MKALVPGGPRIRSGALRGTSQPVKSRSSSPITFSGSRFVRTTSEGWSSGILALRRPSAIPRPASTSTILCPRPTAVEGPWRCGFSYSFPVPTVMTVSSVNSWGSSGATISAISAARQSTPAPSQARIRIPIRSPRKRILPSISRRPPSCCRRRGCGRPDARRRRARARCARRPGPCGRGPAACRDGRRGRRPAR